MQRCNHCGKPVIKFPVKRQQEKTLSENLEEGTINWLNLFKIDLQSVILIFVIIFMVIGYKADIAKCDEVIQHPCTFCEHSGCCDCFLTLGENNTFETMPIIIPINGTG